MHQELLVSNDSQTLSAAGAFFSLNVNQVAQSAVVTIEEPMEAAMNKDLPACPVETALLLMGDRDAFIGAKMYVKVAEHEVSLILTDVTCMRRHTNHSRVA